MSKLRTDKGLLEWKNNSLQLGSVNRNIMNE